MSTETHSSSRCRQLCGMARRGYRSRLGRCRPSDRVWLSMRVSSVSASSLPMSGCPVLRPCLFCRHTAGGEEEGRPASPPHLQTSEGGNDAGLAQRAGACANAWSRCRSMQVLRRASRQRRRHSDTHRSTCTALVRQTPTHAATHPPAQREKSEETNNQNSKEKMNRGEARPSPHRKRGETTRHVRLHHRGEREGKVSDGGFGGHREASMQPSASPPSPQPKREERCVAHAPCARFSSRTCSRSKRPKERVKRTGKPLDSPPPPSVLQRL